MVWEGEVEEEAALCLWGFVEEAGGHQEAEAVLHMGNQESGPSIQPCQCAAQWELSVAGRLLEHHTDLGDMVLHTEALGSSSCRGMGILRTVAGSVGTTDSMVVAALWKCQSLLLGTVQPVCWRDYLQMACWSPGSW